VGRAEREIRTLSRLLPAPETIGPNNRKVRGIIDLGGEALKFLFGVVTTKQLQKLHNTVESIKTREGEIVHAAQEQLTYLKTVDESVSRNTGELAVVVRSLKTVIINAWNQQREWNESVRNLENVMEYQSNVSRIMRELEFMVIQLQQSALRLQEGLDVSATGRLSSVLIPPSNLSRVLQEVVLRLPQGISLIAGFAIEDMYKYYEVATVQAYATSSNIRLVVRIPLKGTDRVMILFRTISLPTYSTVLNRHIQIVPETSYLL
jgi:hypothetical protein